MADMEVSDERKDEMLMQFLSMTDDRVDPDVAQNLLAVVNWDVQAAIEQLYGGPMSRPGTAGAFSDFPPEQMGAGQGAGMDVSGMGDMDNMMHDASPHRQHIGSGLHPGMMPPDMDEDLQFALAGGNVSEEDLIQQALKASQQEEDNRQRSSLREQQEMELRESILMDQMREQTQREEQQQIAEVQAVEEKQKAEDERKCAKEEQRVAQELEAKKSALPSEPAADEPGRLALMLRLPGGKRLQRAFRNGETIGVVYDYLDVTVAEISGQKYHLVSTHPRKVFQDRQQTLTDAGIGNQFVLMVELSTDL